MISNSRLAQNAVPCLHISYKFAKHILPLLYVCICVYVLSSVFAFVTISSSCAQLYVCTFEKLKTTHSCCLKHRFQQVIGNCIQLYFIGFYKLKLCLFVCLFVRHHFDISNLGPSNHRRIMLDQTHYASLERR